MTNFSQIISFLQVVDTHSFAQAARKLNLSTAAVSRHITQLETHLGIQLLQRSTRQLSLTDVGLTYYQACKKLLDLLSETEANIARTKQEASGVLKITANRYFASTYLIPHLKAFLAQNPKLQVKLELAERFPDLRSEKIDILFGVSIEGPSELVRRRLVDTSYVLCASPAYLKKHGQPKSPQELIKHHYIAHSERKPFDIIRLNNGNELNLTPYLQLNDTMAMKECALDGLGIIYVHDYVVREEIHQKKLVPLLTKYTHDKLPVYLYYQQQSFLLPKIRRFIDFYMTKLGMHTR